MEKAEEFYAGFDLGSDALHYAVLDGTGKVVYSPEPLTHYAKPLESLREAWKDLTVKFGAENIKNTSFTGSVAESFQEVMPGMTYEYDSVTIPKGAKIIDPEADSILHIGAKDAYFFELSEIEGNTIIQQANPSSKCGGGSGTLVAKQCRRLLETELDGESTDVFEKAYEIAKDSDEPSKFLARCGIVIQSDLIHKQNEGISKQDNLAGLFNTVADNYLVDVLGNKRLKNLHPIATGGVMANPLILARLQERLGVEITQPESYENVGAIGAAYKGIEEDNNFVFDVSFLDNIRNHNQKNRLFAERLSLEDVNDSSISLEDRIESGTKVVLGIDGGSTTTKGALIDMKNGDLLDKLYISTHGDPVNSLKEVISYLSRHRDDVEVLGVATTGSARELYQKILVDQAKKKELTDEKLKVVDRVTDEITCHALGIKHQDPEVGIIYEIGGQDMKFTEFNEDGTVKEAKMNFSCQAGGGQTLENMASIVGLDVKTTLQEEAFKAKRIPIIDSTCGVFMEMDLNRLISEGSSKEELAAAIIYGTAESYINKFVGKSGKTGNKKSSAQGGPALGKAFLAALAQVSENEINAYPHREMFGAWGAALDVRNGIRELEEEGVPYASAFRGWDVSEVSFSKETLSCKDHCETEGKKNCGVRDCTLENIFIDNDKILTGGFCPVGNSEEVKKPQKNYLNVFHKLLDSQFKEVGVLMGEVSSRERDTIGIRRSTGTIGEKGIWSASLLSYLGFTPVLTPQSDHEIAKKGVASSRPEFCIARKLVAGHGALIRDSPHVKYSFNPSLVHHVQEGKNPLKYCIYTESEGYLLNDDLSLDKNLMINPLVEFGDEDSLIDNFYAELRRIGWKASKRDIGKAIDFANIKEEEFKAKIAEEGDKFLEKVEGLAAYVGLGRDYVILDSEASSNSGEMFSRTRGLHYIPQTFLMHKFRDINIDGLAPDEYWFESRDILKAQIGVAQTPGLYGIRMTNFGCGPDSMKLSQETAIQEAAGKPLLILSTDGHTSNAQFVTRTEAHERVVNKHLQNN